MVYRMIYLDTSQAYSGRSVRRRNKLNAQRNPLRGQAMHKSPSPGFGHQNNSPKSSTWVSLPPSPKLQQIGQIAANSWLRWLWSAIFVPQSGGFASKAWVANLGMSCNWDSDDSNETAKTYDTSNVGVMAGPKMSCSGTMHEWATLNGPEGCAHEHMF